MRVAVGSQCKLMNRGLTCILFGSLKINLAAAFWINCRGWMELAGRPAKRALSGLDRTRAWTRSCVACSGRKGLIFLKLYNANLQDWAVLVMWSEKFSLSLITTPRFLAVFEGVMFDVPNWMVKLWWNDGFAETTSSSVLARLSWRWWSIIQQEMSVRHAEMRAAIVRASGWNERWSWESSA